MTSSINEQDVYCAALFFCGPIINERGEASSSKRKGAHASVSNRLEFTPQVSIVSNC